MFVIGVIEDIVPRAPDSHLVNHIVSYFVINFVHVLRNVTAVTFTHQLVVILDKRREETLEVGNAVDGATLAVLEQQQKIL